MIPAESAASSSGAKPRSCPSGRGCVTLSILAGHHAGCGAGVVERPGTGEESRAEEQHRRDREGNAALGDEAPIAVRDESAQADAASRDGVHERARGGDEPLEPGDNRVPREDPTRESEVGGGGTIEAAELQHTRRSERFRPPASFPHERLEPAPGLVPVSDETSKFTGCATTTR